MGCSLQSYRQRIGLFHNAQSNWNLSRKSPNYSQYSCQNRFIITLLVASYVSVIFNLPVVVQSLEVKDGNYLSPRFYGTFTGLQNIQHSEDHPSVKHLNCCIKLTSYSCNPLQLNHSSHVWDPGTCNDLDILESGLMSTTTIFIWMTRAQINKLSHALHGNRGQRGRGITCMYWNKGPSFLTNKQNIIQSIVAEHRPHILGLGEANFKQGLTISCNTWL
jgi:hypothetical protein